MAKKREIGPVTVVVSTWDSGAAVHDVETGIFGSGASPAEAFGDFLQALHDHLDVLSAGSRLSPWLQAQRAHLRKVLSGA